MTHTSTEQPEALRLASVIATPKRPAIDLHNRVASELLRQHARIEELEEQLAATPAAQEGWCDGCSPDNCCGCGPGATKAKHGEQT